LAFIAQGSEPLLISDKVQSFGKEQTQGEAKTLSTKATPLKDHPQIPMCRYLIKVGNNNNVKPGNILGAIANEADMDSEYIGVERLCKEISNYRENLGFLPRLLFFSSPCLWFLENFLRPVVRFLSDEMPSEVLEMLQKTVVCGKRLNMAELTERNNKITTGGNRPSHKKRTTGRKKFSRNHKQGDEYFQVSHCCYCPL
jgi:ATP-dependent RNA helicase DeaD